VRALLARHLDDTCTRTGVRAVGWLGTYWCHRLRLPEGLHWTGRAVERADVLVDAFDAALVRASHASALGAQQRADAAREHARAAMPVLLDPPDGRVGEAGDALVELALAAWASDDFHEAATIVAGAADLAEASKDDDLAICSEAIGWATTVCTTSAPFDTAGIARTHQRAVELGNHHGAFVASFSLAMVALIESDPVAGLAWTTRALEHFVSYGGADVTDLVEAQANHYAVAADLHQAARLYAAASTHAERLGSPWPRHPGSGQRLEMTRAALGDEFQELWDEGTKLTLDDLLRLGEASPVKADQTLKRHVQRHVEMGSDMV
jgi:hypothetical protein